MWVVLYQCLSPVGAPCNPQGWVLMLHAGGLTVVLTAVSTEKRRLNLHWPMILGAYCFLNVILRHGQLSNDEHCSLSWSLLCSGGR